jgi:hypothetical protein
VARDKGLPGWLDFNEKIEAVRTANLKLSMRLGFEEPVIAQKEAVARAQSRFGVEASRRAKRL